MKNLLLITCLFMGSFLFAQNVATSQKEGVFDFQSEVLDYGSIEQNTDGNRQFVFKNTGNAAIIISQVKASCGCTVVTKPEKPILPGENGKITVNYATQRIGSFSKTISVISNASENRKLLRIKGVVVENEIQNVSLNN